MIASLNNHNPSSLLRLLSRAQGALKGRLRPMLAMQHIPSSPVACTAPLPEAPLAQLPTPLGLGSPPHHVLPCSAYLFQRLLSKRTPQPMQYVTFHRGHLILEVGAIHVISQKGTHFQIACFWGVTEFLIGLEIFVLHELSNQFLKLPKLMAIITFYSYF